MIEADVVLDAAVPTAELLAERYAAQVHRFAAMVCRDRAQSEDLAQDAMLKAMRGLARFDPSRGSIEAWLWRIVLNAARDANRAGSRAEALWERLVGREPPGAAEDTESIVLRRIGDAELLEHVRRLPRRYQTLIALRFGAGLSYQEMGELLGEGRSALRQATRRALLRLRAQLEETT
jgi:RNA polymerase sigma-70 factor (ECF subfamily)